MFGSSMVLTVGHALDRARDEGGSVRLNVSGEWITGRVISHDGHGVALLEANGDMCVLRPEAISGIRVPKPAPAARPMEAPVPIQQHHDVA